MSGPIKLSKADARRALVRYHFRPAASALEVFDRLRSIQFDPIAPVGCNHDLVLQARLSGYQVGDWEALAYRQRHIYDGWDKQAALVPFTGWPVRRLFYDIHPQWFAEKIFDQQAHAVEAVLRELETRGPLMPKEFEFQDRKSEWKGSWFGPSVTKQVLRALWHSGKIMTSARRGGQHIYDLTERVVPPHLLNAPKLDHADAQRELVLDRHRAMGIVRPGASAEVWSYEALSYAKHECIAALVERGEILPIDVEGMKAHATPELMAMLDQPSLETRVVFVAPLDPFMWDRKMIAQLFGFEYTWEIYTPESKRKWGYYVLPVLYGDALVARIEFSCRNGVLEVRQWHTEGALPTGFWDAFNAAQRGFMDYCSATQVTVAEHIDSKASKILGKRGA